MIDRGFQSIGAGEVAGPSTSSVASVTFYGKTRREYLWFCLLMRQLIRHDEAVGATKAATRSRKHLRQTQQAMAHLRRTVYGRRPS